MIPWECAVLALFIGAGVGIGIMALCCMARESRSISVHGVKRDLSEFDAPKQSTFHHPV